MVRPILGGTYLEETYSLGFSGATWQVLALRSFDRLQREYRVAYLDAATGLLDVHEGHFDGDVLTVSNLDSGTYRATPEPAISGRLHLRVRTSAPTGGGFRVELDASSDGGLNWLRLARLKATPAVDAAASGPPARDAEAAAPQLERLRLLVGEWDVRGEMIPAPRQPFVAASGQAEIAPVVGGRALREELKIDQGAPIHGVSYLSWDPLQRLYRLAYLDDFTGILDIFTGSSSDAGLLLSNTSSGTFFPADPERFEGRAWGRARLFDLTDDAFRLHWEISYDRGASWHVISRLGYTRRASRIR